MRLLIIAIVIASMAVLVDCSYSVSSDDIVGSYILNYSYGTEKLRLDSDGTYIQSISINNTPAPIENKGKWEFNEEESQVILTDAMRIDDFFGNLRPNYWIIEPGLSVFTVRRSLGEISLLVNPDQGYVFKKIKD